MVFGFLGLLVVFSCDKCLYSKQFLRNDRMEAKEFSLMPVVLHAGFQVYFISTNLEESQSLSVAVRDNL